MINELVLFIVSVLPVFLIGLFVYMKDREKEPAKLLVKLFLGGILSCIMTLIISYIMEIIFPFFNADESTLNLFELIIYVFVGIALVEETCKWVMVYKISYNDKEFDEFYDMILYAVFVSLGFACIENLFYVYQNGVFTGIIRALLAVPGHACYGVLMGYYLGLAKINALNNRGKYEKKYIALSIIVPTIAHGIYDYCLTTGKVIFIIIFFAFIICMYVYIVKKIKSISSINRKMKYKNRYCTNCGHELNSNYCPGCGKKNE
jgi:RsiW-degrading membrane proteinase PrsW (M82 family)